MSEALEDQRCCVESVLTEEQAKAQEVEAVTETILDIPAEVAAVYNVYCCRRAGGDVGEIYPLFWIKFIDGDIL